MDIGTLKTDSDKERNGVWIKYPDGDAEFRIARSGGILYERELRKILSRQKKSFKDDEMTIREKLMLIAPVIAKYVILDWKNLTENGKDIKYSEQRALEMLQDEAFKDFFDWVIQVSSDAENYHNQLFEESEKN